ncbi:DNA-directed RNA polymerase II subunit RPB1-like [Panicum miliaceum]|uniref:DNA-directed RNA polymerase II subunit RPB1-like n=1 Tax=Panicum miliaceum TaxID=4540 RepID=A0A3L6PV58_PANMI|nr:DNA-directed RNA polymerase II subunit RPB1-like [Panicum miliaceum]
MAMVSPSPAARSAAAAAAASCCFSASSGGPFVVTRRPCFPADLGVDGRGGRRFCYQRSSSSSLACSPRAGSTPEYAPSSPSRRAGSLEYTPLTPSSRGSAPPDY